MSPEDAAGDQAQPVIQAFMKNAQQWTESRGRAAAGLALADSATKAWGRPSNKERWAELQAAINALQAQP